MKEQKFIYENDELNGVEGEKTIKKGDFNLPCGFVEVLVTESTENNEDYFNIYIIDGNFKVEPINCFKLQEPKSIRDFSEMDLELMAIEHYLSFKYSTNEDMLSFNVECIKD